MYFLTYVRHLQNCGLGGKKISENRFLLFKAVEPFVSSSLEVLMEHENFHARLSKSEHIEMRGITLQN